MKFLFVDFYLENFANTTGIVLKPSMKYSLLV